MTNDPTHPTDLTQVVEQISRAEIDVQIATAKRYPRSLTMVKQSMMSFATLDQETAEACFYTLPRAGKLIKGPSIRLAEIAVSCFGNLRAGTRIIETVTTGDNPHVTVQAMCFDVERNVAVCIEKRRRIFKKKGKDVPDDDDINLAANAGSAIAFRDAVFKVVPQALVKPVYEQAVLVAVGNAKTLAERRAKALDSFGKMGVSKEKLLAKLGRKGVEEIELADMEILIGLHTAIKDGDTTVDEAFPEPEVLEKKLATQPPVNPLPTTLDSAADAQRMAENVAHNTAQIAQLGRAQTAPESPLTPDVPITPQRRLWDFIAQDSIDFVTFQRWGIESGVIPNADSIGSIDEVPTDLCNKLMKAQKGLRQQLLATKASIERPDVPV